MTLHVCLPAKDVKNLPELEHFFKPAKQPPDCNQVEELPWSLW